MTKHAYLIMAHNEPLVFQRLLSLLDDERNDIYVHIDRKAKLSDFGYTPRHSQVFYVDRHDVRWGGYSQIQAELTLMRAAASNRHYAYYHLLSGVDLPLKTQDAIHLFFNSLSAPWEFVGFTQYQDEAWVERARFYHLFTENQKTGGKKFQKMLRAVDKLFVWLQSAFHRQRHCPWQYRKGPQWFSITDGLCRYVLSQQFAIAANFRHINCVDEWFLQTIVYNTPEFYKHVYRTDDEFAGCLRAIDWQRSSGMSPYTWGGDAHDAEMLLSSDRLFARKFSSRQMWLVDELSKELL